MESGLMFKRTPPLSRPLSWLPLAVFILAPAGLTACKPDGASASPPAPGASASLAAATANPSGSSGATLGAASANRKGLQWVKSPSGGTVEATVQGALARATATQRTLLVYVGAAWCEPCQRFHHAAEQGDLDAVFPTLTVLEFDLDRDRERLAAAGYVSQYIPLFALPAPDGKSSGKQIEGGTKGDHAVGSLVPRLKELLSD
jgi:hypothetical protein